MKHSVKTTLKLLMVAISVAAVLLGAVFAQPNAALERVIMARLAPSALLWLHAIAQDKDLYTANGVFVEDVQAQNSAALVQAIASNSANAGIALGDNAIAAIEQNAPVIIAGAVLSRPVLRLFGAGESIEDLRGKAVTAGAVQGGTTNLMLWQLKQAGLTAADVQIVAVPNSRDRVIGMQNGELAGGLLIPPFDELAIQEGFNLLDVYRDYWLQTPLVFNKNWAEANRSAAEGTARALATAAAWIYDPANRDEAIQILAAYTSLDVQVAEAAYEFMVIDQQAISPDLSVPAESITNIFAINAELEGTAMPTVDISRYYDPSYLGQ
jgi:ABC-type nitrate/sulfonate/bicarbonate transport system substrate-binding protein